MQLLVDEEKPAGRYEVNFERTAGFNKRNLFLSFEAGSFIQTKKSDFDKVKFTQ
ncbi:MAG: hypothetical protein U5J96_18075 [Ignavibacteriaceae bacterium]|nr:hypothetical protein [Ignavibacteriaceae bacterium]